MLSRLYRAVSNFVAGERVRHRSIIIVSFLVSVAGVVVAAFYLRDWNQGGRGGAFASAFSLFGLFANRSYGGMVYDILVKRHQRFEKFDVVDRRSEETHNDRLNQIEVEVRALRAKGDVDSLGQGMQNRYSAISAAIGTAFWGYGDLFARGLMHYAGIPINT